MIAFTCIVLSTFASAAQMQVNLPNLAPQPAEYYGGWEHVHYVGMEDIASAESIKYYSDARYITKLPDVNGVRPSFLNRAHDVTQMLIQMADTRTTMEKRMSLLLHINRVTGTWTEQFRLVNKELGANDEQDILMFCLTRALPYAPGLPQMFEDMNAWIATQNYQTVTWSKITLPENLSEDMKETSTLYDILDGRTYWLQEGFELLKSRRLDMMTQWRTRIANAAFANGATQTQINIACADANWPKELLTLHIYHQWDKITNTKFKSEFVQFLHTPQVLDAEERAWMVLQKDFDGTSVSFFGPYLLERSDNHKAILKFIVDKALIAAQNNSMEMLRSIVLSLWVAVRPTGSKHLYRKDKSAGLVKSWRNFIQVKLLLRSADNDERAKQMIKDLFARHTNIVYGPRESKVWKAEELLQALRTDV